MKRKSLKAKPIVSVFICSFALILLCACGSNKEKTMPNVEDSGTAEGSSNVAERAGTAEGSSNVAEGSDTDKAADIAESENTEAKENAPIEKSEEPEQSPINTEEEKKDISLIEITWEDFEDGTGNPVLHFSFSNDTVVDKELLNRSIVKNITYQDITGDGVDEIIIYREFVNNIHDDYCLMDFFKIEDDTVTEISPSTDIPELADIPWHTEVVDGSAEGYEIMLTMESYGKEEGVLYTDMIMTVGYDKESWKLVQQQKAPD